MLSLEFLRGLFQDHKGLGYMRDVPDSRDLKVTARFGSTSGLPTSASAAHPSVQPRDQGMTNSCVGYSTSTALRLALLNDGKKVPNLSAFFAYYNSRRQTEDHSWLTDSGTYIRDAIKATRRFGICAADLWPHDYASVNKQPSWNAYRMAHDFRGVRNYYRVSNPDEVRLAIANGRPVVGGWAVNSAFTQMNGSDVIDAIDVGFIGNHAMVLEAYDDEGRFTLHNSWGRSWRNRGRALVTEGFVERMMDGWAIDT